MLFRVLSRILLIFWVGCLIFNKPIYVHAENPRQEAGPTVTALPGGTIVTVTSEEPLVNLRGGPNTIYPKVGTLLAGQSAEAIGRSPGGEWVVIRYPGVPGGSAWVASRYLIIPPGTFLPVADIPPTPGPQNTQTIDPTLAAQWLVTAAPTRLPTFTPAPPLVIPTLPSSAALAGSSGIPMGMVIIGLGALGIFLGLISLIRGR